MKTQTAKQTVRAAMTNLKKIELLRRTLERIDMALYHNESYRHQWINHPTKPTLTPKKLLRKALRETK